MFLEAPLFPHLKILICQYPELERYRRQLCGSCCRALTDAQVQDRVSQFLLVFPQHRPILEPLLAV